MNKSYRHTDSGPSNRLTANEVSNRDVNPDSVLSVSKQLRMNIQEMNEQLSDILNIIRGPIPVPSDIEKVDFSNDNIQSNQSATLRMMEMARGKIGEIKNQIL